MRTVLLWVFSAPLLAACATTSFAPPASSGPIASPSWRPIADAPDGGALSAAQAKAAELKAMLAAREDLDSSEELFDCLTPGQCPTSWEERAKRRAAARWSCPAESILATPRPTKGLQAPGSQMVFNAGGRAEYHAAEGVKGDAAFDLSGCEHRGIIACIPAHRSVSTPHQSYDNVDDHLCLWAKDPGPGGP